MTKTEKEDWILAQLKKDMGLGKLSVHMLYRLSFMIDEVIKAKLKVQQYENEMFY